MRISAVLLVFFLVLNGWAGMLMDYGIDTHMGVGVNTGNPEELRSNGKAVNASKDISTGQSIAGTLLGMINAVSDTIEGMYVGLQPGLQMLKNISPPGIISDIINIFYPVLQIIMGLDIAAWVRGVDL